MKHWTKLAIGLAAVALSIAVGTGAYAMRDGRGGSPTAATAERDDGNEGAQTIAGMCAPGYPDCVDTVVDGMGDEASDPAGGARLACATVVSDLDVQPGGGACLDPWFTDALTCPDGETLEQCFPDGTPVGYTCYQLESFPVQTRCEPTPCDDPGGPITILPAPAPDTAPSDPPTTVEERPEDIEAAEAEKLRESNAAAPCVPYSGCGMPVEGDGIAVGEPYPCLPPDCGASSDGAPDCLPPDCVVSSDGTTSCPAPDPCALVDPLPDAPRDLPCTKPLPPGCEAHDDGSVSCEGSAPPFCGGAINDVCEGGGSSGCEPGPAVDCGPVDPVEPVCEPGPAVDCGPIDAIDPGGALDTGAER